MVNLACATLVRVTILAVNDPPMISQLDTIFMVEDEPVVIQSLDDMGDDGFFMDPDNDLSELTYQITILDVPIELNWNGNMESSIELAPSEVDFFGEGLLNLCISDGEFEVCGSAVIIVQPVNDAPYFTSSFEQELGLNVEFDILISADDVDSDSLTISMVSDFEYPSWFEIQNNHVTGTPLNLGEFNLLLNLE